MLYQTIPFLSKQIVDQKITAVELTLSHCTRIEKVNKRLNAIVIDTQVSALKQAKILDQRLRQNDIAGPLHGIPITIKESFNITGLKTTINYPRTRNNVASSTSILVERLQHAGAIILGKTNVPIMLADAQTFGPLYPTCNNPYDISRSPGGSTGGGAAALASGMSNLEIGSDIGGSIRNPAHFCGLFGLKPTENNHAQDGHIPPLPNDDLGYQMLASTGPLARSVEDLIIAFDVAFKPRWDYLQYLPINTPTASHPSLKGYRIAWFDEISGFSCDQETTDLMKKVALDLSSKGVTVEKINLSKEWSQNIFNSWATLYGLVAGQDMNWLMRNLLKLKFRSDLKHANLDVNKALNNGLNLNFMAFSRALRLRQECTAEFSAYFDSFDFIICPTACGPAIKHNPKHQPIVVDDRKVHYLDYCFSFVLPFNAMGNPSLVFPAQQDNTKLPIGLQCIGRHHAEPQLLHFGQLLEESGYQFRKPELD